jgi:hypothetical protein
VKTHGERYAHYRANVGRFVPASLKPYKVVEMTATRVSQGSDAAAK